MDGNILFINVMNRLSLDCDCEEDPREPEIHDIGILASFDPVALDQACTPNPAIVCPLKWDSTMK